MIEKFNISRDERWYEAWPDVTLTASGKLVCVFNACTHHADRSRTQIMLIESDDRGRTWHGKRALTPETRFEPPRMEWWNCPRISTLSDGRLVAIVDYCKRSRPDEVESLHARIDRLYISEDEGRSWSGETACPAHGIVPDQLVELRHGPHVGRWIFTSHHRVGPDFSRWRMEAWYSDDEGGTWAEPALICEPSELQLCEGSIVEMPTGELVCFMRENSGRGMDAYKAVSTNGGETWGKLIASPIPACHRPVAGMLRSGNVLITHRYMQGGRGWVGWWTQNVFAAWMSAASALAGSRNEAECRILPLDYDRSGVSDTGYTGWVQFEDGEIYVVNYLVDDNTPRGQIRGYSFRESDIILPETTSL